MSYDQLGADHPQDTREYRLEQENVRLRAELAAEHEKYAIAEHTVGCFVQERDRLRAELAAEKARITELQEKADKWDAHVSFQRDYPLAGVDFES